MSRASSDATGRAALPRVIISGSTAALTVGVLAAAALALTLGASAAWSALGTAAVVTSTFVLGVLALTFVLAGPGARPELAMAGAFVVYTAQIMILTILVVALRGSPWIDDSGVVVGGVGAVLAWMAGHVHGFSTARIPVFTPAEDVA